MKAHRLRETSIVGALRALAPIAVLAFVAGCSATAPAPTAAIAVSGYRADEHATEASAPDIGSAFPVVPVVIEIVEGLVSEPVMRPVSSLHRLFFLAVNTTVDLVKPASLLPVTGGPVPPLANGPGMDLEAWERKLDALTGTTASRGTMRFLVDGDAFFSALTDAVVGARSSVDMRMYIFDTDDYATAFADLLKRRSKDVEVRVLVDGLGTTLAAGTNPETMPRDFEQPGSIAAYLRDGSDVAVRVQSNPWLTGDHSRTFIVDRQVAFIGGMNIGREYRYDWHDLMVEVRGPVVGDLDREFQRTWSRSGPFGELAYLISALRPRSGAESGDGPPIRTLYTKTGDSQIYRAQLAAIRAAKRYIHIENPYFSDDEILAELVAARRRGVDVRVILPSRNDSTVMDHSNVVAANAMFRNGIRVFLYPGFTHVKAAIYDGWACLGSANLDKLSLRVNEELNLATSHRETVQALQERVFEADFEKSVEMTEPLPEGLAQRLAAFVANQL